MTALATERSLAAEPAAGTLRPAAAPRIVVYGDFNCPWSYLAFRRTRVLAAAGLQVDWRAVEHDPRTPARRGNPSVPFAALQEEMDRVLALLLPGEELPYDLAGFVPRTGAAVAAYAESYVAQAATRVRRVLFESFWMHGIDIGDAGVLRTLLTDELSGTAVAGEPVRDWGCPVDLTGGPISTAAWRVIAHWSAEWQHSGKRVVPVLQTLGAPPLHGVDAVEWLGGRILEAGLSPKPPSDPRPAASGAPELPDLGWTAASGGRRLRRWQHQVASTDRTAPR